MKYDTERYLRPYRYQAEEQALKNLIHAFTNEMRDRIAEKFKEGRSGWDDPQWTNIDIKKQIIEQLRDGNYVDVANLAMFAWNHKPLGEK